MILSEVSEADLADLRTVYRWYVLILVLGAVVLALGLAWPAHAQITSFASANCNSNLPISNGGLTLGPSSGGSQTGCIAGTPKWSGLKYYEATPNVTPNQMEIGVSANTTANTVAGVPPLAAIWVGSAYNITTPGAQFGTTFFDAGLKNGTTWWNSVQTSGTSCPAANGKTVGIAADLNTDPPQVWTTCDVTGTGGLSGGPLWNNSATSSPTVPGSGIPGTTGGTGAQMFFPGYAYFPAFVALTGDEATFNFGATSFVGTLPTGYTSWNSNVDGSGTAPNPGPTNPMTINVANAPEWQTGHVYVAGDRVVAGPAWVAGSPGSYTNGSAVYLWATTNGGTSLGSGNGPQTCGTPANTGGGIVNPTSAPAGWSGATTASDNGITWTCLSKVDYVTMTGAFADDPSAWATGTTYFNNAWVVNAGNGYRMTASMASPPYTCLSASSGSGPTGTTLGLDIADNTCNWQYQGAITYTSLANQWPHQFNPKTNNDFGEVKTNYRVNLNVWYGGKERQVYQPGQNGEKNPILMTFHNDVSDGPPYLQNCKQGWFASGITLAYAGAGQVSCNGTGLDFPWTVTAVAGDSWVDNVTAAAGPMRADPTKGVMFYSTQAFSVSGNYYTSAGEPFAFSDQEGYVSRLQFQAVASTIGAFAHSGGPGNQAANNIVLTQSILDAGGGPGVIYLDSAIVFANNLLIYRGSTPGCYAIKVSYPGPVYNNTAIGNGTANCTFIQSQNDGVGTYGTNGGYPTGAYFPPPFKNNVFVGFPNPWGYLTSGGAWPSALGANNATDVASSFSGGSFTNSFGEAYTSVMLPGISASGCSGGASCYSLTPANEFVNPTVGAALDMRVKGTGANIYGAGAVFSFANDSFWQGAPLAPPPTDIFGSARPTAGRYDIGAEQFAPGSSPPVAGGGLF